MLQASRAQFRAAGFSNPTTLECEGGTIDCYPKLHNEPPNIVQFPNGDFVLSVGTFLFKGLLGHEALRLLYEQGDAEKELPNTRGHFVVIMRKNGQTRLLRDPLASYEIFRTIDKACV